MTCNNQDCGEDFLVKEHHLAMPGTKEKEPINCPYCNETVEKRMTNGYWETSKKSN